MEQFDMSDEKLLVLKLRTGEEIVGMTTEDERGVTIKRPLKIVTSMGFTKGGSVDEVVCITPYLGNVQGDALILEHKDILFKNSPSSQLKQELYIYMKHAQEETVTKEYLQSFVAEVAEELTQEDPVSSLLQKIFENPILIPFLHTVLREHEKLSNAIEKLERAERIRKRLTKKAREKMEEEEDKKPKKDIRRKARRKFKPSFDIPFDKDKTEENKNQDYGNIPEDWSPDIKDYLDGN